METRRLGDMRLSLTGLGLAGLGSDGDYAKAESIIHAALDSGINFFDTADIYGHTQAGDYNSEEFLGRALAGRRNRAFISTKFGYSTEKTSSNIPPFKGLGAAYAEQAVDASLRRLRADHIDLYQPHTFDPKVPIEETLGALARLIEKGKIRSIGSSRFTRDQIIAADAAARAAKVPRFISTQAPLNLLQRATLANLAPTLDKLKIGLIPFTPLANGFLTGKYKVNEPPPPGSALSRASPMLGGRILNEKNFRTIAALSEFAEARGHSLLELAFAWLAAHPRVVSVIAGATSPQQVMQNAKASAWKLTKAELTQVDAIVASFDASDPAERTR
jgi:aryl-alcohol dehydrogenase-like predicted oxidoreductase